MESYSHLAECWKISLFRGKISNTAYRGIAFSYKTYHLSISRRILYLKKNMFYSKRKEKWSWTETRKLRGSSGWQVVTLVIITLSPIFKNFNRLEELMGCWKMNSTWRDEIWLWQKQAKKKRKKEMFIRPKQAG